MKDLKKKEKMEATAQSGQSACQVEKFTIEEFHRQLEENTQAMNKEREEYAKRVNQLKRDSDDQKDIATQQENGLQIAREAFNATITAKLQEFNEKARRIRDFRRKASENFLLGIAGEKSRHAKENERISMERHIIFERWRNSGGQLADASGLLHPGWRRTSNNEEGGMSDGEE